MLANIHLFAGTVCLIVLPATLSRTAWIAAIVGCAVVLLSDKRIIVKLRLFWKRRRRQCILGATILSLFLFVAATAFIISKDSADGRLFMWKITALAIQESPVKGTGLGGFPAAYAKAQMEYFKNGKQMKPRNWWREVRNMPSMSICKYFSNRGCSALSYFFCFHS